MSMFRSLSAAILCAVSVCLAMPGIAASQSRQPIWQDGSTATGARGIWRSTESGWILEIDTTGITRWQETPVNCYPTATDGPTFMGQVEYRYFHPLDNQQARFEYLPGDGHAIFEQLDALPSACSAEIDAGPVETFETFVAIFDRHYAFFEQRGVDWAAITDAARDDVRPDMTETELFEVLAGLIAPLGDSHTKLFATIDGENRRAQFGLGETLPRMTADGGETPWLIGLIQQLFTDVLDPGAQHIANDRVILGRIDDRVGYIQFLTMGGFTSEHAAGSEAWARAELDALDAILDTALDDFSTLDGVILDLTNNRGGYDAICRAIASRFTDAAFPGYSVRTDWEAAPAREYEIVPYDGVRFTGPVYVLTSDVTVSCGEITTLMLRQQPNVTQAGATTRGAFSTPLAKPLPNGWYVELSNEIFADASGAVFEGHGLVPDLVLPPFPAKAPIAGHARLVETVVESIPQRHD